MSGDVNQAIARLRDWTSGQGWIRASEVHDALRAVLDAIEGGEWEDDYEARPGRMVRVAERFCGPWQPVDPQ